MAWYAVGPVKSAGDNINKTESNGSTKIIIIVFIIIVLLVAVGVTVYAHQNKILCFEQPSDEDDEPTGQSPLLNGTTSGSKLSASRTNTAASATSINQSRPSHTNTISDRQYNW